MAISVWVVPVKLTWMPPGNLIFISPLELPWKAEGGIGFFADKLILTGASLFDEGSL